MALGEFELIEHRASEIVDVRAAGQRPLAGQWRAVERDAVESRADAADGEAVDEIFIAQIAGHPRQPDRDLARIHVRQVAEGIHRDDVLHVVGIALRRDRRRPAPRGSPVTLKASSW